MSVVSVGWSLVFIITMVIGGISFFHGEWGIWLVALVFWIISILMLMGSGENSESKTPIQSTFVSESDLRNNFAEFNWRQMEELTGELFRRKGYDVEVTQSSADFGIDVWATNVDEKIGIQVKHWNNDVGFREVTQTLGSNLGKANKFIVISTKSFFTNQAYEHQKQHTHLIELWDTNKFKKELRENFSESPSSNNLEEQDEVQEDMDELQKDMDELQESHGKMEKSLNEMTELAEDVKESLKNIVEEEKAKPTRNGEHKKSSFDYDQGFNIDEVYDSSEDEYPELGKQCTKCGSPVFGDICGGCGKEIDNSADIQDRIVLDSSDRICQNCQYVNPDEGRLCGKCGQVL